MRKTPAPAQPFGNLMQTFSAQPYRGKTIRLRASIRVETANAGGRAQMWLRVDLPGKQMGLFDNMDDRPITSPEWKAYDITGEVEPDARSVNIGVMLIGDATAWIDDVRFEIVEPPAPSPEDAAARLEIQKQYDHLSAAVGAGKFTEAASLAVPDARTGGRMRKPFAEVYAEMDALYAAGTRWEYLSSVKFVQLKGSDAVVVVEHRVSQISGTGREDYLAKNRDIWTRSADGWRLKEAAPVSSRAIPPKFDPEAMKPVVAELRERAVPLTTTEAGHPVDDLAALGKSVGDARIVALGEASHGTREFFQMKHRLLEYLVRTKGFTVFAIEANWPEALEVDRYIKAGEGEVNAAMSKMYFWTWYTEEVRDMIEWMRAFNHAPGEHPTLTFTSFDMQTSPYASQRALDYLKRYSPGDVEVATAAFAQVNGLAASYQDDRAKAASGSVSAVLKIFDEKRAAMEKASSHEAWRDARQAAAIVQQSGANRIPANAGNYRDRMMAANVEWLLSEVHPKEKVVLWAHNGHVSVGGWQQPSKGMGAWLRERFGRQMYVVGFAFRRGQLRAIGFRNGKGSGLGNHDVPPAPESSGSGLLGMAGMPLFYLDLAGIPEGTPLSRWLNQSHFFYDVGAGWQTADAESNLTSETLAKSYDGIIFVDESHAARPLPPAK